MDIYCSFSQLGLVCSNGKISRNGIEIAKVPEKPTIGRPDYGFTIIKTTDSYIPFVVLQVGGYNTLYPCRVAKYNPDIRSVSMEDVWGNKRRWRQHGPYEFPHQKSNKIWFDTDEGYF